MSWVSVKYKRESNKADAQWTKERRRERESFPSSINEASITLMPKPDKDKTTNQYFSKI